MRLLKKLLCIVLLTVIIAGITGVGSLPVSATISSSNLSDDDIIYMVMTDRFYDGNTNNNGVLNEEYRPGDLHYYQGGDWQGLTSKLDYIKSLGFTAIWISPRGTTYNWIKRLNTIRK